MKLKKKQLKLKLIMGRNGEQKRKLKGIQRRVNQGARNQTTRNRLRAKLGKRTTEVILSNSSDMIEKFKKKYNNMHIFLTHSE